MVLNVLSKWSSRSSAPEQKKSDSPVLDIKSIDGQKGAVKDTVDAAGSSSFIGGTNTPKQQLSSSLKRAGSVEQAEPNKKPQRFSMRPLGLFNTEKSVITHNQDVQERQKVDEAAKHAQLSVLTRSADKRAQKNALVVQHLIVGPNSIQPANTKVTSRPQLTRIKSELMQPKSANRVIAKLRDLPMPEERLASPDSPSSPQTKFKGPIQAVCLEGSDDEIHSKHFSKLDDSSIGSSSFEKLTSLFNEMHIVDLVTAPDLGLGQPEDGKGLLAGAIPTVETVFNGVVKLTPELMALGYATGKAVITDTTGVSPPTDRLSVLTYWWGLELCMPPPTLAHLANVPSVSQQVINFLSALSIMSGGIREILPFVRYIGQYIDFEWSAIQAQDQGKGVVCAATWIMPAALTPRPWDFDDPASSTTSTPKLPSTSPAEDTKETKGKQSAKEQSPTSPLVVSPLPAINSGPSMLESQKAVPITVVA